MQLLLLILSGKNLLLRDTSVKILNTCIISHSINEICNNNNARCIYKHLDFPSCNFLEEVNFYYGVLIYEYMNNSHYSACLSY